MFHSTRFQSGYSTAALLKAAVLLTVLALAPTLGHAQAAQVKKEVTFGFQLDACQWLIVVGTSVTFRVPPSTFSIARYDQNIKGYYEWDSCTGRTYQPSVLSGGISAGTSGSNNFSGVLTANYSGGLGVRILFKGRLNLRTKVVENPTATVSYYVTDDPSLRLELNPITTIASWY